MQYELIKRQEATYPYSKLDAADKLQSEYEDFDSFIKEKIQKYCAGEPRRFNRTVLAKDLGLDRDTLTKIINGGQRTQKRDIIIAICLSLQLSTDETNQALELYSRDAASLNDTMAPLNPNDPRDCIIMNSLTGDCSVTELNEALETRGFQLLDVVRNSRKEMIGISNNVMYEELSVEIIPFCIAGDDSDRSLHDRYRPDRFDYHSEMIVRNMKNKGDQKLKIVIEDYKHYDIFLESEADEKCLFSSDPISQKYYGVKPCTDPELLTEVTRLREYTDRKARYVKATCADTRNYGFRFDAVNDHGQFVIYGESFGYDAPELCEYYQIEVSSHGCKFTVSEVSRFMERYLGPEKWQKMYGVKLQSVKETFSSLKKIPYRRWRSHFQKLLKAAKRLLDQIREGKVFLTNARAWIDVDALISFYCKEEDLVRTVPDSPTADSVLSLGYVIGEDGETVTINDLFRAAELDIFSLKELSSIRARYGSIDNFLHIDALEVQEGKRNE